MATFPLLKTGAVAQYPLESTIRFPVQTVRFLNGSQQNYLLTGGGLRRWTIRLDQLDEAEAVAVIDFAELQGGSVFAFADPATGDVVTRCIIGGDRLRVGITADRNAWSEMYIEEVV